MKKIVMLSVLLITLFMANVCYAEIKVFCWLAETDQKMEYASDTNNQKLTAPDDNNQELTSAQWTSRGWVYITSKLNYAKGEQALNKSIELNPNYAVAYNLRAYCYYESKLYDLSLADCNKAIELNPIKDKHIYFLNRANTYYCLKRYQEAIEDYQKAIEFAPEDSTIKDYAIGYMKWAKAKLGIN